GATHATAPAAPALIRNRRRSPRSTSPDPRSSPIANSPPGAPSDGSADTGTARDQLQIVRSTRSISRAKPWNETVNAVASAGTTRVNDWSVNVEDILGVRSTWVEPAAPSKP